MQGELSGIYLAEISDFTFHLALKNPYKIKEACTYSKYTHALTHNSNTVTHTHTIHNHRKRKKHRNNVHDWKPVVTTNDKLRPRETSVFAFIKQTIKELYI